jgi:cellulose 1,4-beta-cellobiosidase
VIIVSSLFKYEANLCADVANYNSITAASPDPITQGNANFDEVRTIFIN